MTMNHSPIKIAISGASGRMGRMLIDAVEAACDLQLVAALAPAGDATLGTPASATSDIVITDDLTALNAADVLIDFTRPEGTLTYLAYCAEHGIGMVIGTTGFDAAGKEAIAQASQRTPIVFAPNMSVAVNTAFALIAQAAALLADYDCEIVEMHHKHKVDAPSGTALEMGRRVAQARGVDFDKVAVLSREGHTGERVAGTIGFASLRGGDVVGDHTVIFAGAGERVEISHKSSSRAGYAQGALSAARFILKKNNGLFAMSDVLGLA